MTIRWSVSNRLLEMEKHRQTHTKTQTHTHTHRTTQNIKRQTNTQTNKQTGKDTYTYKGRMQKQIDQGGKRTRVSAHALT